MYCPVPHQTTILHGQKYPKNGSPLHQCCSCFIFSAWNKLLESLAHFSDKCGILLHSVYLSFYSLTNKVGVSYMYSITFTGHSHPNCCNKRPVEQFRMNTRFEVWQELHLERSSNYVNKCMHIYLRRGIGIKRYAMGFPLLYTCFR